MTVSGGGGSSRRSGRPSTRGSATTKDLADVAIRIPALAQILRCHLGRHGLAAVPVKQQEHAAAGSARRDAEQALAGGLAEVDWEIGHHEQLVGLGDASGLCVVVGDGGVLVAQVELGDLLDVLVQIGETLLDVVRLSPDPTIDQAVFVIGQVHQPRKGLSQSDWVQDREQHASRRRAHEQPQDHGVECRQSAWDRPQACVSITSDPWPGYVSSRGNSSLHRPRQHQPRVRRQTARRTPPGPECSEANGAARTDVDGGDQSFQARDSQPGKCSATASRSPVKAANAVAVTWVQSSTSASRGGLAGGVHLALLTRPVLLECGAPRACGLGQSRATRAA